MQVPTELSRAIAELSSGVARPELMRAAEELTAAYGIQRSRRPQLDASHRAAYLVTRLPATYAVLSRILGEVISRIPGLSIEKMLDLGAGPGTAMWAAAAQFRELQRVTLVEDSAECINVGRRLAADRTIEPIASADWRQGSVVDQLPSGAFDLVTMSYVLNELRTPDRARAVELAWERTGKVLVVSEPGTPAGFEHIRAVRSELLARGAHMVAPCPHVNECPMSGGDWCHFAERLQRTADHRAAKGGELGYEDEKFSYVVFARQPAQLPSARILRHPRKHSGHVELELCAAEALERVTVSRKQGDKYKAAKKAQWGSTFE